MNNLSWFIYLAELVPSIGGLCFFFAIVFGVSIFGCFMLIDFNRHIYSYDSKQEIEEKKQTIASLRKGLKIFPLAMAGCIIITTLLPSKNTIMMIAASEYGESLYKSDQIQEILNPASKLLKSYIQDELSKREKSNK